ncbi:MAG: ethanolamine utilization protein EutN [Paracoccaceae bacterium]|jgi:ethanolamine utilization protein EutN
MRVAQVIGTTTATVKDARLTGATLLVVNFVDGKGKVLDAAHVAVDTCGAGVGDTVLIAQGGAARLPAALAGAPVDAAIIAIIDQITLS